MKRRKLLSYLTKHGCQLIREGSNHSWWGNPENRTRSAVPRHTEISNILCRKICKDLGVQQP